MPIYVGSTQATAFYFGSTSITPYLGSLSLGAAISTAQIVIFAGQSQTNSNGTAGNATDVPTALAGPMADVMTWDPYGKTFQTYQAGVNSGLHLQGGPRAETGKQYFGAEAEFARLWKLNNPGVKLYIIKQGYTTTGLDSSFVNDWSPTLSGKLYDNLKQVINDAKANLVAAGLTPAIRTMFWTQGETDATQTTPSANYQTNLSSFIDACRTDFLGPDVKFVVGKITNGWTNALAVRAAQTAVVASKANCFAVEGQDLTLAADTIHYNPFGVTILGRREQFVTEPQPVVLPSAILSAYYATVGASPDTTYGNALLTLVTSLVNNGVWNDLANLQVYASYSQSAALVDLKSLGAAINTGMTWDATGFTGTGTTSGINTGVNPSTGDFRYTPESAMYAMYLRQRAATSGAVDLGANATGSSVALAVGYTGSSTTFRLNNAQVLASNTITGGYANVAGLWAIDRAALASMSLYRDGVVLRTATDDPAPGTEPTVNNIWVGNRGGASNGGLRTYGAFAGGKSLTTTQHVSLANAINTYMTAVGAA